MSTLVKIMIAAVLALGSLGGQLPVPGYDEKLYLNTKTQSIVEQDLLAGIQRARSLSAVPTSLSGPSVPRNSAARAPPATRLRTTRPTTNRRRTEARTLLRGRAGAKPRGVELKRC